MNLKNLTDTALDENLVAFARQEREVVSEILHHLRENDRRRLFSSLGYQSLYQYAIRRMGYSEDEAYRRISAMRLLKEVPELETKLESGALSLSHVGLAQTLFRNEPKTFSHQEKIEVLEKLENTSKREAQRVILSLSTVQPPPVEKIKPVTATEVEIRFTAPAELQDKIEKLKGLLAHSHPKITLAELMDKLCEFGLNKLDPARHASRKAALQNAKAGVSD